MLAERIKPRAVLLAALGLFLVYAWPGFIGWDTRDHMIQAREGTFSNGHPPAVILLVRICDFFVRGPALVLIVQAVSLLTGLYLVFSSRLRAMPAAIASACVFLWPPLAGITALIAKDGLMAGFLMIGVGLMLRQNRWALAFVLLGAMMRWNSLPATFALVLFLFQWSTTSRGLKRYAIALAVWVGISTAAYGLNSALVDRDEHFWYWSSALQDIAGTIEHADLPDDELAQVLEGTPLRFHDHLNERFHKVYSAINFYQLMRDGDRRPWDLPTTDAQFDAIARAWKTVVLGHPRAYLEYRVENFRYLNQVDRSSEQFTNVYVWFTVFAAPSTIQELDHDAAPSRLQGHLIDAAIWCSLTPLYFVYVYFAACFVMLLVARRAIELALLLSAIGFQLSWFFLAQSTDYRYSSWMELCCVVAAALITHRVLLRRASRRTGSLESAPAP